MAQKPSIPKGTRDFTPVEMAKRNYIFDTIREAFHKFSFSEIETPAMENLSTLMGKYGEEGDKLLFKILNSGDYLKDVDYSLIEEGNVSRLAAQLCEKGLRYDLTVPFARFVVQHRSELQFPFKRFQMQPVWRADRPQKGRYREFYQCDADIIGSDSLWNEVDLIQLIDDVFNKLNIRISIKLNNRKVLAGIAELINAPEKLIDITVAIDKIDKIGIDNVNKELSERGLSDDSIKALEPILNINGTISERLAKLTEMLAVSEIGTKGVNELRTVVDATLELGLKAELDLDVSLARGLNYYTGTIIEVKAKDIEIGSITGGGRYDNLTGVFGLPGVSGVGISFGADRIYDVLNGLNLYPANVTSGPSILFLNFGLKESAESMKYIKRLRELDIPCMLYPDTTKMKKQMSYANEMKVPFVALIGESEMEEGKITLKNMVTGEQKPVTLEQLVAEVNGNKVIR